MHHAMCLLTSQLKLILVVSTNRGMGRLSLNGQLVGSKCSLFRLIVTCPCSLRTKHHAKVNSSFIIIIINWNTVTLLLTNLKELVKAVGSLLYQHLPASVVVVASRKPHHSHLVDQSVRPDDVVPLVWVLLRHCQTPRCLAWAWQAYDHYYLSTDKHTNTICNAKCMPQNTHLVFVLFKQPVSTELHNGWPGGSTVGCEFNSRTSNYQVTTLGKLFTHICASVTKQYVLVPAKEQRSTMAGKVWPCVTDLVTLTGSWAPHVSPYWAQATF